jgi:hypothetical protein
MQGDDRGIASGPGDRLRLLVLLLGAALLAGCSGGPPASGAGRPAATAAPAPFVSATPDAVPIVIVEAKLDQTVDCEGAPVTIQGDRDHVTLTGQCQTVLLQGDDDTVVIDAAGAIRIRGDGNTVAVARTDAITVSGDGNTVTCSTNLAGSGLPSVANSTSTTIVSCA